VCRWAGDEYVILLPDTTAEQAERALERTRRKVATYDWSEFGLDVPVTISVGIASAARGDDRRTLFAAADGVLYDAKRSGRDRVVRLSGVTQTRAAGTSPLDALFGPPPSAVEPDDTAAAATPEDDDTAVSVEIVQPSPLDARCTLDEAVGFAPLLVEPRPIDPPLGTGSATEPLLGPVPAHDPVPAAPVAEPVAALRPVAPSEPEVIWGTGRTTEKILALVREARREYPDRPALVLRAAAETLVALAGEHDAYTTMDAAAMAAAVGPVPEPVGRVHVLCASGADTPVAAEAAFVARVTGTEVVRVDDVAGSRIRAMLTHGAPYDGSLFADADCLVVVAGMDASLAAMVGAMADVPVVAVPTSTGAPNAFAGLGALMTMLNSAAPGVAVSTIDNGYGAGVFAARVARRSMTR
jgi:NCAIR mutase (PurE)-related protein